MMVMMMKGKKPPGAQIKGRQGEENGRRWECRVSAPPLAVSAVPEPLLSRHRNPVGEAARQPLSFTPKRSHWSSL